MEAHNCADILLLVAVLVCGDDLLFVISLCNDREEESLNTEGRLDNVGDVLLICLRIEVLQRLTAGVDVLCKVVVSSVCYAPELAPAEWEEVFKVCSCL